MKRTVVKKIYKDFYNFLEQKIALLSKGYFSMSTFASICAIGKFPIYAVHKKIWFHKAFKVHIFCIFLITEIKIQAYLFS